MDIDRARSTAGPRRNCFQCGEPGHIARDCPRSADVRVTDVLDEVARQLGGDLLEELVARVTMAMSLPSESDPEQDPEDFVARGE